MRARFILSGCSPISLASQHVAGNFAPSLDYIPGTALRGALAAWYHADLRRQRSVATRLKESEGGWSFEQYLDWLFLSGEVRFPNLYFQLQDQASPTWVMPSSARSCKYNPGPKN